MKFPNILYHCTTDQRALLLKTSNYTQFKELLELIYNLLYGNIKVNKKSRASLLKHSKDLHYLISGNSLKAKKHTLIKNKSLLNVLLKIFYNWTNVNQ